VAAKIGVVAARKSAARQIRPGVAAKYGWRICQRKYRKLAAKRQRNIEKQLVKISLTAKMA
jgi:hypothetical protein